MDESAPQPFHASLSDLKLLASKRKSLKTIDESAKALADATEGSYQVTNIRSLRIEIEEAIGALPEGPIPPLPEGPIPFGLVEKIIRLLASETASLHQYLALAQRYSAAVLADASGEFVARLEHRGWQPDELGTKLWIICDVLSVYQRATNALCPGAPVPEFRSASIDRIIAEIAGIFSRTTPHRTIQLPAEILQIESALRGLPASLGYLHPPASFDVREAQQRKEILHATVQVAAYSDLRHPQSDVIAGFRIALEQLLVAEDRVAAALVGEWLNPPPGECAYGDGHREALTSLGAHAGEWLETYGRVITLAYGLGWRLESDDFLVDTFLRRLEALAALAPSSSALSAPGDQEGAPSGSENA